MWLRFVTFIFLQFYVGFSEQSLKKKSTDPPRINKTITGIISTEDKILHDTIRLPVVNGSGIEIIQTSETNCTSVTMCIRHLFQPSNDTDKWNQHDRIHGCACHYKLLPARLKTWTLSPGLYHIAFAATDASHCRISVVATWQPCNSQVYGLNCTDKPSEWERTDPISYNLPFRAIRTFEIKPQAWQKDKLLSNITFTIDGKNTSQGELQLTYKVREGDFAYDPYTPLIMNLTNSFPVKVIIPVPRAWIYSQFVSIINTGIANVTITVQKSSFKAQTCPPGSAGSHCQYSVGAHLDSAKPLTIISARFQNQPFYYAPLPNSKPGVIKAEDFQQFWIGLYGFRGAISFSLYLRIGNIPTEESYDMMMSYNKDANWTYRNANPNFYLSGPTISTMDGKEEKSAWYIGVQPVEMKDDMGLWVQHTCPGKCSDNGKCMENHECDCYSTWRGWYCEKQNSPPTPSPNPSNNTKNLYAIGGGCAIGLFFIIGVILVYRKMGNGTETRTQTSTSSDYLNPGLEDDVSLRSRQNYNAVTIGVL